MSSPWETLRFEGNKINCFLRVQSVSVYYHHYYHYFYYYHYYYYYYYHYYY